MIRTIIGVALFLIPFLLVARFKEKRAGFFYVLSFLFGGIFFVSFVTQLLGIFNYWIILLITLMADVVIFTRIDYPELIFSVKKIKINWIFAAVILILLIELYSVHYNYTGTINTITGWQEGRNIKYTYPYFSDEWVSASLIQYSIDSGRLPLVNPLWHNSPFSNFHAPFHVFSSGFVLLFGIDPVRDFAVLPLLSGIFICILIYFILRINNVNIYASAIAALSVPYLLNGANLPGLWYFIPITLGFIFMLLGWIFMASGNRNMVILNSFFALLFYPPLAIFILVSVMSYLFFSSEHKKSRMLLLLFASFIIAAAFIFIFIFSVVQSPGTAIDYVLGHIFYTSLLNSGIPDFSIFKIVPYFALLFGIVGFFISIKGIKSRLWLILPLVAGFIFWMVYSMTVSRFLIEYPRVVFVTSVLIVLLAGFGMDYALKLLDKSSFIKKYKIIPVVMILILILSFILAFYYTNNNYWMHVKLHRTGSTETLSPAPPANKYLNEADLQLFTGIKEKNFLSYPWKGLAVGVATGNYPLVSKESIITNNHMDYQTFMMENCVNKLKIAKEKDIDDVYLDKIDCPGFELVGISVEDMYLYRIA
jgi:hypothetical protein